MTEAPLPKTRPMRAMLLLLLCVTACAAPEGPGARRRAPAEIVAELPETLRDFRRNGGVIDFEPRQPGLGAAQRYAMTVPPGNGFATAYVYDRGAFRQPDGAGSPDVARELEMTEREVAALVGLGTYRSAAPGVRMEAADPRGRQIACSSFTMVLRDGTPTGDAVCVTIRDGRFWKMRLSLPNPGPEGPMVALLRALGLLRDVLSPSGTPGLRPNT